MTSDCQYDDGYDDHHTHLHGFQLVQEANEEPMEDNLARTLVGREKETVAEDNKEGDECELYDSLQTTQS